MSDQSKIIRLIASPAGVVIVALLLRLGGVIAVNLYTDAPKTLFHWSGSAAEYPEVAYQILAGNGFCFRVFDGKPIPTAYLPPGYAYLLAGAFRVLGDGLACFVSLQLLHVILGTIICWLTYRLGELIVNQSVGLAAGYICALYPTSIFMSTQLHPVPIHILLNLLIVLIILTVAGNYWAKPVALGGLLQGALILFRPQTILYAPILGVWLGSRLKATGRMVAPLVFLGLAAAVVAPWTIRNYVRFGKFIPVINSFGFNLWRGQNDLPHRGQASDIVSRGEHPDLTAIPHDNNYEIARDDIYRQAAIGYIKTDLGRALINAARKIGMFWTYNPYHQRGRQPLVWGPWAMLAPFFVIGLVHSLRKKWAPWMFYAYLIVHTGLCAVFLCLPRYRMFIEPIIFIFAAAGLVLVYQKLKPSGASGE